MSYNAVDIANWFIANVDKESGDVITHLKVQKLLYFAEAWCQALFNKTLFNEEMEAWAHGPVVRAVYEEFSSFGWQPLEVSKDLVTFDQDINDLLSDIFTVYGKFSAKSLEHMTHEDQPWINARNGKSPEERCTDIIPKQEIKTFFLEKYAEQLNG